MATITITPGNSFTATEAVTSTKLNDLGLPTAALTAASIGTADIADDAITTALIADDAITPALIAVDAVTTPAILDANVTFAKLTDVIDDDTMATATDTNLATSESIKAYVDSRPGLQGSTATGTLTVTGSNTFQELDLSSVVGSNKAMVIMEVFGGNQTRTVFFRTKGSSPTYTNESASSVLTGVTTVGGTVVVTTDSSGKLEWRLSGPSVGINYVVQAFQVIS